MFRKPGRAETIGRRAGQVAGALAGAAVAYWAFDKIQVLRVKHEAGKLGVGEEHIDLKK